MIPFDFEYYKPDSIIEAVQTYQGLSNTGKNPFYYAGGTEIISMARVGSVRPGAVIDIKGIPECCVSEFRGDRLILGAAVPLTHITESRLFPLLGLTGGRVADHTIQHKITLGGNLAGTIIYRETVLPLLLTDSRLMLAGPGGQREILIHDVFDGRLCLQPGEFLVQVITEREFTGVPFVHVKKTRQDKIDYPLLTVAALKKDGQIRAAFSGLCGFPFRSRAIEKCLNDKTQSVDMRLNQSLRFMPAPILSDIAGSAEFRAFVFRKTMTDAIEVLDS
ncbi:MAG: FAD binding domain-containing protein [Candidatus Saccharibacteria bacterium]